MGREIRMVPKDWEHPKNENGNYIALFEGGNFEESLKDWNQEEADWNAGKFPDYASDENKKTSYEEWNGEKPLAEEYMPVFREGTAIYYMMYEDTSEGTPISPAFRTPEGLAIWLVETGASSFAGQTASYEAWLRIANGGWAPSAVYTDKGGIRSGVEAMSEAKDAN